MERATPDLPDEDIAALAQLTRLEESTVRVEEQNNALSLMPLSRLTNLESFVVRGLSPDRPSTLGTGGGCLPKSLKSLTVELGVTSFQGRGASGDPDEDAQELLNTWVAHAAGITSLVDLCIFVGEYWFFESLTKLQVASVPHLTQLKLSGISHDINDATMIRLPADITKLTNLQVLWVGTHSDPSSLPWWPWHQHHCHTWGTAGTAVGGVLSLCSQLQKLGHLRIDTIGNVQVHLPHLTHLDASCWDDSLPGWLAPCNLPVLRHLVVESEGIGELKVAQLAKLTNLTCLQLNTGGALLNKDGSGWKDLSVLGHSLPGLRRLEIVGHHLEPLDPEHGPWKLSLPDLSAFSQLQQLRLTSLSAEMLFTELVPHQQVTAAELVRMGSRLTQIQQLELIGYVVVTPAVVSILLERMPALRVLKVGIPESQLESQSAAQYVGTFRQVQEVYSQLRPSLQLEVIV